MIKFFKMHGLGNDFIILDGRKEIYINPSIARELSNRRTGIGCDQLMIIKDSNKGCDLKLIIFNADGSFAEACGNGARCVAKLIMQEKNQNNVSIETDSGILEAWIDKTDNLITVNMGSPKFLWKEIPLSKEIDNKNIDLGFDSPGKAFCLSMGNPHAIIFVEKLKNHSLELFGPKLENHSLFPNKANISMVEVISQKIIKMKVWERGVGITNACGSAACASVVAGNQMLYLTKNVEVILDGGKLLVSISKDNEIYLKGPSEKNFDGVLTERLEKLFIKNG